MNTKTNFRKTLENLARYKGFSELWSWCRNEIASIDDLQGNSLYDMYNLLLDNKSTQKLSRTRTHYNSLLFSIIESINADKKKEIINEIIHQKLGSKFTDDEAKRIAQREFLIMLRNLLSLTINGIQMIGFWSEYLDEYPSLDSQKNMRKSSDVFLYNLIKKLAKEIPDDFVEIEKKYKLISATITFFSKKYLIWTALRTYTFYLKNYINNRIINIDNVPEPIQTIFQSVAYLLAFFVALLRVFFSMPLFSGLLVGWLFLLQAGDAIKYILKNILMSPNISPFHTAGLFIFIISCCNFIFIFFAGPRDDTLRVRIVRSVVIIILFTGISFAIGWGLLNNIFARQWLGEVVSEGTIATICNEQLRSFIGIWSSIAVFIGIFAQIIWSGRGPTEIND